MISSFVRVCFLFMESNLQMFPEMADLEYNKSETYHNIRVFTVGLEASTVPLYDLKSVMEKWSRPSPGEIVCLLAVNCVVVTYIFLLHLVPLEQTSVYNKHFSPKQN